eukprot:Phypoly_transcript_05529.p1 GENE.Phypoly_transcript_05529~~Phypoly_transcript_05529.p1  ORF type:complete len:316 (-),score=26.77 Phypoly_transcript_05529:213-1160(-)
MRPKYGTLTLPIIKAALRGTRVAYADKVPGTGMIYGEHLSKGTFINSPGGVKFEGDTVFKFVPTMSPLQLLIFAFDNVSDEWSENYPIAKSIIQLFNLEPNFNFQQFEEFHANYECLRRNLFLGEPNTMSRLYRAPMVAGSNNGIFHLSSKSPHILKWPGNFPGSDTLCLKKENLAHVIMPTSKINKGFDVVCFNDGVITAIECRFSGDTDTTLTIDDVQKKRRYTEEQFRPHFKKGGFLHGLSLTEDNLFLVICAFRRVAKDVQQNLPKNTIVLDRAMLQNLYTPSLSSQSQFVLQHLKEPAPVVAPPSLGPAT